jgi:hypothetical protein
MSKLRQQLISETITCFYEEDGIMLTEVEAIAVLDSFADLYLAFVERRTAAQSPA